MPTFWTNIHISRKIYDYFKINIWIIPKNTIKKQKYISYIFPCLTPLNLFFFISVFRSPHIFKSMLNFCICLNELIFFQWFWMRVILKLRLKFAIRKIIEKNLLALYKCIMRNTGFPLKMNNVLEIQSLRLKSYKGNLKDRKGI